MWIYINVDMWTFGVVLPTTRNKQLQPGVSINSYTNQ
ncbi:hypothetical protein LSH36_473g02024 [Paralvinella palmiformis]|uniref:Uncharacterized protein n=1 Tax=Paralvinella palmiformis TaxID=53620 RepID=A0AAD9J9F6_9ANNE|nr:hypothetical protein LSH36_473g02024 [Paralvinella palmiformis]